MNNLVRSPVNPMRTGILNTHSARFFLLFAMLGLIVIPSPSGSAASERILLIIDAKSNRHPISPYIYGVNEGLPSTLGDLNIKLNRWGGNRATRYNWKEDTTSTAADWYFQNLKSGPDRAENEWKYKDYELFIRGNQQNNCDSLITIPMIGRVAKDDKSKSFSVSKYGPQHAGAELSRTGAGRHAKEAGRTTPTVTPLSRCPRRGRDRLAAQPREIPLGRRERWHGHAGC